MIIRLLFLFVLIFQIEPAFANSQVFRIRTGNEMSLSASYEVAVLRAALEAAEPNRGPFTIQILQGNDTKFSQKRAFELLKSGNVIDVEAANTSRQLEMEFEPARIAIYGAYSGTQLFLTRKDNITQFESTKSVKDLSKVKLGFEVGQPELEIFKKKGVGVITALTHQSVFEMLKNRRFDATLRSILEPTSGLYGTRDSFLDIDRHLAIQLPLARYFFFRKERKDLAQRVEEGLSLLLANGDLDRLIQSYALRQLPAGILANRSWLLLANPDLPDLPPDGQTSWNKWWATVRAQLKTNKRLFEPDVAPKSNKQKIRFLGPNGRSDFRLFYHRELLELALQETIDEGDFELQNINEDLPVALSQSKALLKLKQGDAVDVVGSMLHVERARDFAFAKFDIAMGLLGDRVFVGLKSKARLLQELSFAQFKLRTICVGFDWPDKAILETNGFKVFATLDTDGAYDALKKGNCDSVLRASFEATDEILSSQNVSLELLPKFQIQYPAALVFFTNKKSNSLAMRIERGLNRAFKDGAFWDLLVKYFGPSVRSSWSRADLPAQLTNPAGGLALLSQDTSATKKRFLLEYSIP